MTTTTRPEVCPGDSLPEFDTLDRPSYFLPPVSEWTKYHIEKTDCIDPCNIWFIYDEDRTFLYVITHEFIDEDEIIKLHKFNGDYIVNLNGEHPIDFGDKNWIGYTQKFLSNSQFVEHNDTWTEYFN